MLKKGNNIQSVVHYVNDACCMRIQFNSNDNRLIYQKKSKKCELIRLRNSCTAKCCSIQFICISPFFFVFNRCALRMSVCSVLMKFVFAFDMDVLLLSDASVDILFLVKKKQDIKCFFFSKYYYYILFV